MNFLMKKQLFLWLFLSCMAFRMHAWENYTTTENSCNACDLGCWSIQIQGGIAPVIWNKRANFNVVSCNSSLGCGGTSSPVIPLFEMPKFNKLFKLPWTIGGLIGYWVSDCDEVYFEGNYRQANAKNNYTVAPSINLSLFALQPQFVFGSTTKYKFYDFFVGARHYFDMCWCDSSFFIGGQVGFVHHKEVDFRLTVSSLTNTCNPPFTTGCNVLFGKNNRVAGGASIGFDFSFCGCFGFIVTADFIATCGPCGNRIITFAPCTADLVLPELRPDAFIIGSIGNEFYFPITVGLEYKF